jgi:hypothetical protein
VYDARQSPPADADETLMKPDIEAAIGAYPEPVQTALRDLRGLVLDTASQTPGVGTVEEALRWGQPSFLTTESGSGSTVRIDGFRNDPSKIAIFFHCRSGLVEQFRALYGDTLNFVGDRAIELRVGAPLPKAPLKHCVALALTHHSRKKAAKRRSNR